MTYDDLIAFWKTEAEVQRALEVPHRQTVNKWKAMPRIPTDWQVKAEVASGGQLLADLPPEIRQAVGGR